MKPVHPRKSVSAQLYSAKCLISPNHKLGVCSKVIGKSITPGLGGFINFIGEIVLFLVQMGILYIGIQRALDLPITYTQMWRGFRSDMALKLIGLYILQILILLPGIFLFILSFA